MKMINISDDSNRNSYVTILPLANKPAVKYKLKNNQERHSIKVIKGTLETSFNNWGKKLLNNEEVANALIKNDYDIDFEKVGKIVKNSKRIYLDQNEIAYRIEMMQIIKTSENKIKKIQKLKKTPSNILKSIPLRWTNKSFKKEDAIKKFVFVKTYQLSHVNGLTYDFLYKMAKKLAQKNILMYIGGNESGSDPIVLTHGGNKYRGFLEGRIKDKKYCLLLHLTNIELKGVANEN